MFYYIEGILSLIDVNLAVLDCGGVGYALNTTVNSLSRLKVGEKARLYVYSVIREDCFDLYGFATLEEKRSFEMLVGVSGVGPKVAQAILSAHTPEGLALAIVSGDDKSLTAVSGIGKKIAQRIIVELKDKLSREIGEINVRDTTPAAVSAGGSSKRADASAALGVLGYGAAEITAALKGLDLEALSVEDIIRQALRNMSK